MYLYDRAPNRLTSDQGITRELSVGEIISQTFNLLRRNFVKYVALFLVVEAVIGLADVWAYHAFPINTLPASPSAQDIINLFANVVYLVFTVGVVSLIIGTIAYVTTIKMASEEVENKPVDLGAAVRFAVSKMLWVWALGIILGIIVGLGFIALVIPGIILLIMFSLAMQALLIENTGVIGSLGRSRELVSHRWLKTFAVGLVFIIIVGIAAGIVSAIASPFGYWSQLVNSILSSFYQPIIPVATTVYFYSNRARIMPAQTGAASTAPMAPPGMKFCTNCGAQLEAAATFCSKCGAKQPTPAA